MSGENKESKTEAKAAMKNSMAACPSSAAVFSEGPCRPTVFRRFYERGDMPIQNDSRGRRRSVRWKVALDVLDYHHFLPLFFDGLAESLSPYNFIAVQGIHEMLDHGGPKILPVVPQLIAPIRKALDTRNNDVMCSTMKVLQHLVKSADGVGEALVPHFKHFLRVFCEFRCKTYTPHATVYGPKKPSLGELVEETLQILEQRGGKDAFKAIKVIIPNYHSCVSC
uniref:PARK2 co-regulated n=1 Tax=Gasterosteus aculeatus aculeatus TaxID=481459 RepID=A0AAQ4PYT9_GASAC|nr:parkin coregulated gene protein homolog isoform X1 [Gasterosteus aculeatus aculeatus]